MKRLSLTSPHTKGEDVRTAQTVLKKKGWLQGEVDGEFGPDTFRATKRAQYWTGFTLRNINGVYTVALHRLLTGDAKPSKDQQKRRAQRLKANDNKPKRLILLEEMKSLVGKLVETPPNSNHVFGITDWYGLTGPWCAMVLTKCGVKAGLRAFKKGSRWAYCPFMLADARKGVNGVAITYDPKPGNGVLYDWDNDGVADHVGVFEKWHVRGTSFWTYEGNTSKSNPSNGGNQEHNIRYKSDVIAFIHFFEN